MPFLTQHEDSSRYSAPPEPNRRLDDHAFLLGCDDRRDGLCIGDNPFTTDKNRMMWEEGWYHEDELIKKDEE